MIQLLGREEGWTHLQEVYCVALNIYMSFKMHITCVGLFSFLWIKLSTTFDITGGNFQKDVYKDSYVIIAENNVGPKMCVNDCFLHKGCNGVVFVPNELLCKLLSISYPEDKLLARSGFYLSEIDSWEKVNQFYI